MNLATPTFVLLLCAAACSHPAPAPVSPVFASRVELPPIMDKLRASGGDPAQVQRPASAADLLRLQPGTRYKFVVLSDGALILAPAPADAPGNEYHHPVLAGGAAVRTAGGLEVQQSDGALTRVIVDQDSKAYCPTLASLGAARAALRALGVAPQHVEARDRPPQCAPKERPGAAAK